MHEVEVKQVFKGYNNEKISLYSNKNSTINLMNLVVYSQVETEQENIVPEQIHFWEEKIYLNESKVLF